MRERLKIQLELNSLFSEIPEIFSKPYYRNLIKDGLADVDNYCCQVAISVLKSNLASAQPVYEGFILKEQFELL